MQKHYLFMYFELSTRNDLETWSGKVSVNQNKTVGHKSTSVCIALHLSRR